MRFQFFRLGLKRFLLGFTFSIFFSFFRKIGLLQFIFLFPIFYFFETLSQLLWVLLSCTPNHGLGRAGVSTGTAIFDNFFFTDFLVLMFFLEGVVFSKIFFFSLNFFFQNKVYFLENKNAVLTKRPRIQSNPSRGKLRGCFNRYGGEGDLLFWLL